MNKAKEHITKYRARYTLLATAIVGGVTAVNPVVGSGVSACFRFIATMFGGI